MKSTKLALIGAALSIAAISLVGVAAPANAATQVKSIHVTPAGTACTGDILTTMNTGVVTGALWGYVQEYMTIGYTGIDCVMGTNSWKGVQRFLNNAGASLVVDGNPGTNTKKALQTFLNNQGAPQNQQGAPLVVDGVWGTHTYEAWAYWLVSNT